ncbi:MAG: hypothetical protein H6838_06150 [Planctomycetes bacterium]|nr:hypothetical protein [Planctomycetota bacterium]MCB9885054.1 hypothetical protein [Planctomycetota bacterium]
MKSWVQMFGLGAGFGAAFVVGQLLPQTLRGVADQPGVLHAQGRGPANPAPAKPQPGVTEDTAAPTVVYTEDHSSSSSGGGFVAVTGSYGVGTSVLYLIDTENRQLAVYEARGGSSEQRRIVFVGARRIDLDLQLERYNDRSEYDYRELRKLFDKRGGNDPDVSTGLEPGGSNRK